MVCIDYNKYALETDGLPLSKGSDQSFWPLLCFFQNMSCYPVVFPLVIAKGPGKPSCLAFLEDTISQLIQIIEIGIDFD